MQNRQYLLWFVFAFVTISTQAQTTYMPLWSKEGRFLDRLEIKIQRDNDLNLSTVKPYMRKAYIAVGDSILEQIQAGNSSANLTRIDKYNLNRFLANSSEYSKLNNSLKPEWKSKRTIGGLFPTAGNMVEVNKETFFMSLNPILGYQQGVESDYDDQVFRTAIGATGRGLVANKVGFQFFAARFAENGPMQFRQFVAKNDAVPGAVLWDSIAGEDGVKYWDVRGSVTTNITKYINVQFGYDRQFIGNGYRSLMLSNFSGNHLFLKLNTRIWKLNYTNLFQKLSTSGIKAVNGRMQNKYASMHHLSVNATKWLNIGVFESIVFGRANGYDISYLQPMIFLRSIEQQNGSPDNANIGFDIKANIAKKGQLYGQIMLDEFLKDEVIGNTRSWWGNKQGWQIGGKYIDAFGINNLDIQLEVNQLRPFMYQFRDTSGTYTHAGQPLANPLGANLREFVGLLYYQPSPKLFFNARVNVWKQGLDSAGFNFGSNPNDLYTGAFAGGNRLRSDNYPMFSGMPVTGINASLSVSYELKENLFVDFTGLVRNYKETNKDAVNTSLLSLGVRWNLYKRDYDY